MKNANLLMRLRGEKCTFFIVAFPEKVILVLGFSIRSFPITQLILKLEIAFGTVISISSLANVMHSFASFAGSPKSCRRPPATHRPAIIFRFQLLTKFYCNFIGGGTENAEFRVAVRTTTTALRTSRTNEMIFFALCVRTPFSANWLHGKTTRKRS